MGFSWIDYLILIVYALGITLFGSRFGKSQHSLKDYFLRRQNLPWWAICFSIVATETSTLTFIGSPAISYGSNLTFLQLTFGYLLGIIVSFILSRRTFAKSCYFLSASERPFRCESQEFFGGSIPAYPSFVWMA